MLLAAAVVLAAMVVVVVLVLLLLLLLLLLLQGRPQDGKAEATAAAAPVDAAAPLVPAAGADGRRCRCVCRHAVGQAPSCCWVVVGQA